MNESITGEENKNPEIKFLKDGVAGQREEVELPLVGIMGHAKRQQRKTSAEWLRVDTG